MLLGNLSNIPYDTEFKEEMDELTLIEQRELKRFREDY